LRIITQIAISGYRSLRDVTLSLDALNVVTGANGSGKSSLYRALRLLADIAQGRIIQSLAIECGLGSVLWAGPEAFGRVVKQGVHPVEGDAAPPSDQPEARLFLRGLRLCDRSRPADPSAAANAVCKRP
jgi:predicted ATPase